MVQNLLIPQGQEFWGTSTTKALGKRPLPHGWQFRQVALEGSAGQEPVLELLSRMRDPGPGRSSRISVIFPIPTRKVCEVFVGDIPEVAFQYILYYIYIYLNTCITHANPCKSISVHVPLWNTPKNKLCRPRFLSWPETTGGTFNGVYGAGVVCGIWPSIEIHVAHKCKIDRIVGNWTHEIWKRYHLLNMLLSIGGSYAWLMDCKYVYNPFMVPTGLDVYWAYRLTP